MPYPKKYTDQQIKRLYDEYHSLEDNIDMKTFCKERELPYTTIRKRFITLEKRMAKGLPQVRAGAGSVAQAGVTGTVETEIAAEAEERTKQFLILGKATWTAYAEVMASRGMSIADIERMPIHEAVVNALEKEVDYDKLAKRTHQLEEALLFLNSRMNPLVRLERGIELFTGFLEFAVMAQAIGVDVIGSPIGEYYENLIENLLTGRA